MSGGTRWHPTAWEPLAAALADRHRGTTAPPPLVVRSDLWHDEEVDPDDYYRRCGALRPLEERALIRCRGRVADLGAGAGAPALALQRRGLSVVALEAAAPIAAIATERGVRDVVRGDLSCLADGSVDTVLMLMNGIGIAGTLDGLDRLLAAARRVLRPGGAVVCDSADLRTEIGPLGRWGRRGYHGEVRFQLVYGDTVGEPYRWLFVDPRTLRRHARRAGFAPRVEEWGRRGSFVAVLRRRDRYDAGPPRRWRDRRER